MDPRLYPRMVFEGPQSAGTRPWQLSASRAQEVVQRANSLLTVVLSAIDYFQKLAMPANNNDEKTVRGPDGTASPQRWKFTEGDDTSEFQQHEEGEWLSFIFIIFHA
ncbi:hypothetical protein CNMCM8980_007805 [Aspergillus fumigatiaffinis]|nr:hypothetical protein CNMCM5878_010313 [Aspergillus fumigatiaffinis]KAF4228620.1 hypothetical protein CNMCM6457_006827 [Aspergillus fumigatiaffinis]KAF4247125.1 hypothetical protein CNMCM8980_007805 [Aspergillus fumigatiaffinis]